MTDHVPAAAEGLPKISRRLFLRNATAAGVAGTVVAVPAVAGPLTLEQRAGLLHELAEQTADAFDAWTKSVGGRWELRIRAADDPYPIVFHNLKSRAKTPDERIDAALEEIKEAMLEKYPGGSCRVCRIGVASANETVMVVSNLSFLDPGQVEYHRDGKVVRREGGAS